MPRTAIPDEEIVAPARRPHAGALSSSALRHHSDDRLVALTRAGSERAFAEIMRRYQRRLYVYCLQLLGAARAEDAVQQAFLQAFVALRDGAPREISLRPWLYRIARNCSIDLLRKPGSDHDQLDPEYDGMPQPPGVLEQKEELAELVAAILALPEGQRRALTLRELEGRSYGEISAELGHTSSGVRQLIFRARTALRSLAGFAFPFGSLRWQLFGQGGAAPSDPHQLATVAGISAPAGGGALQTVGSIVAATVTLAAGGGAVASPHRVPERTGALQAPAPSFAARGHELLLGVRGGHEGNGRRRVGGGGDTGEAVPGSLPLALGDAPVVNQPVAPLLATAPQPAAAGAQPAEPSSSETSANPSPTLASTAGPDATGSPGQKPGVNATAETTVASSSPATPTSSGSAAVPAPKPPAAAGTTGPSGSLPKAPAKVPPPKAPAAKAPKAPKAPKSPKAGSAIPKAASAVPSASTVK